MNLELLATRWLKWDKRCHIVIMERSPRALWCGHPDVLGVTKSRYLYEIEIKRTLSDFRADADKPSRRYRDLRPHLFPKQFYYLVPANLASRVNGELPDWAGLMRGPAEDEYELKVVKTAPVWPQKRLTAKEYLFLVMKMANQIVSLAEANYSIRCRMNEDDGWDSWQAQYHPGYTNYQI